MTKVQASEIAVPAAGASLDGLVTRIGACRVCSERFRATTTGHSPRPVAWLSGTAPILIIGQAPGARVHKSGLPFDDPSGDRLRDWLGVDRKVFYDRVCFAILPMAFCFPGYDSKGSDLPPPRICAETWGDESIATMPQVRLTLLVGGYAQKWHLDKAQSVTECVHSWEELPESMLPLPHPSWRNTGWIRRNTWFERDLVPHLRRRVRALLSKRSL